MIIGEAPGEREIAEGKPFVGPSGYELDQMLLAAGLNRNDFFVCNVTDERPINNDIDNFFLGKREAAEQGILPFMGRYPALPIVRGLQQMRETIDRIKPRAILATGNTPLWALTGQMGIMKWRGSEIALSKETTLVPIIHPAAILREWNLRQITVHDIRRFARVLKEGSKKPDWQFKIRPTFEEVRSFLEEVARSPCVACDIETRGGQIACVGIAISPLKAICIPFMCVERPEGYWSENEEVAIVFMLRQVLTSRAVVFQNGIYDLQYFAKQFGFVPSIADDTMIMQHTLFPGLKKSLDFLASMYCSYYQYWKDDGKLWTSAMPEDDLWKYNCEDCVRTFECFTVLNGLIKQMGMREQYDFQLHLFHAAFKMMLRGINIDQSAKSEIGKELKKAIAEREEWLKKVLGHPLNVRSPKKIQDLFYHDLNMKPVLNRKTRRPTANDEALKTISRRAPLLTPLVEKIEEIRSLGVFKSTFAEASLSEDGRMRCSINLAGTVTFRFSTSEDAFGSGTNLQNLPKGTEE